MIDIFYLCLDIDLTFNDFSINVYLLVTKKPIYLNNNFYTNFYKDN